MNLHEAQRYTRRLARSHYENFVVGGLLTPRHLRQHFYNLYAYCRAADDLADEIADDLESLRRLAEWRQWVNECYDGPPPQHPILVALHATVHRFGIPRQPLLRLLDAFEQDQRVKRYRRFEDLLEYCQRSANPVGHLVLYLSDGYDPQRAELADEICTGLQLANFCQDVRRDAEMGRVYLPEEELIACGIEPSELAAAAPPPGAQEMLRAQVDRAEAFFHRGLPLAESVPRWLGRYVRLVVGGGLAIIEEIRRADHDVWTRRPTVRPVARLRLVWNAMRGRSARP